MMPEDSVMSSWSTLETVFFLIALALSIAAVAVLFLRRKRSTAADRVICLGSIATMMSTFTPWYRVEFIKFTLWDTHRAIAFVILGAAVVALAIVCTRVLLFGKTVDVGSSGPFLEGMAILVFAALAAVFAVIRWIYIPETKVEFTMMFVYERSWGAWAGLISVAILAMGSIMKIMEGRQDQETVKPS